MPHDHDHAHHDHAHAHDHDHAHDHGHASADEYLQQLLTLLVCGVLGTVAILMVLFKRLDILLVPEFHPAVLVSGVALLVLVAIRAASLWASVGSADDAGHVHGPDCDHGHGHEHGSADTIYLKLIPFMLPFLLFVMGLPNQSFSQETINRKLGAAQSLAGIEDVKEQAGQGVLDFEFAALNETAYDPGKRAAFQGRAVRIKGQVQQVDDKRFRLYREKVTCCASDMVLLKAEVVSKYVLPTSQFKDRDWVTVEGVLQFVEQAKGQVLIIIRVSPEKGPAIQKATPE